VKTLSNVAEVLGAKAPGLYPISKATGLLLQVNEAGNKSWAFRYRLNGTRRIMGLGSASKVSLADARKAATAAASQRDSGVDPIEARRKAKQDSAAANRPKRSHTFRDQAEEYITIQQKKWKRPDAGKLWSRTFEKWVYPTLGNIDVADIDLDDVVRALEKAWTEVPETAQRMRWRIAKILHRASALGLRDKHAPNPASIQIFEHSRLTMKPRVVEHFRAAPLDEAPGLFKRIREASGTAFRAHEFMILTTTRGGEALRATWSEIDLDKGSWTLPPERTKSNRAHVVPLTQYALAVLEAQAAVRINDYVFPGLKPNAPLSYDCFAKALLKIGITYPPHSWRSIFRDFAGDIADVPRDIAEAQLAHKLGATEGSYRRLTAVEKRRALLSGYHAWLHGETVGNVVQFPAATVAA
jgi:integrase